jgi:hypothetical protein
MRSIFIILFLPLLWGPAAVTPLVDPGIPENPLPWGALPGLKVSANGRYLVTDDGKPFFWLGDTGWLLLEKLSKEDAVKYLEERRRQGFNVIQVMLLHGLGEKDIYGDKALVNGDLSKPDTSANGGYWDQVDYVVKQAADRGIYVALVPLWGGNVKSGRVNVTNASAYARFLARRYKDSPNVIWMNGGDIKGSDHEEVWNAIGTTLKTGSSGHLVTYHPRGRTSSSTWFHGQSWLDFNSVQSGHRRYNQDTSAEDLHYGEDNWRYIRADYDRTPVKPVLDAEPSYERIPQGLHDIKQPKWTDKDVRRYAYWSVFAGACGFTYGDNPVMQMHKREEGVGAYGAAEFWEDALRDPGAEQMRYLKALMLSRPYFERIPDQSLVAGGQGEKYNYLIATMGKQYAFIYTYNGRTMSIRMGRIAGDSVKASWYNPRDGSWTEAGLYPNRGVRTFDPPGETANGNDWVLVLDGVNK